MNFYQNSVDQVLQFFSTNLTQGLSADEVILRRRQYGPNLLPVQPRQSCASIFIQQFCNPLVYILSSAAVLILLVGEIRDALIIGVVLLFNAIFGTVQEWRTTNMVCKLRKMLVIQAVVVRAGVRQIVDEQELVPGDIIILQAGDQVPADARLLVTQGLRVNESVLTGELLAVTKNCSELVQVVPLGDRCNMLYQGTHIVSGQAQAVVVATGLVTELGQLSGAFVSLGSQTKLQKDLDRLSYLILLFIAVICAILFVVGIVTGKSAAELFTMLTALFICVVPEGLPVVLTLILVTGAYRMAKEHVLVKKLRAIEALGQIDTLIMDKTGTLTYNAQTVKMVYTDSRVMTVSGLGYQATGELFYNGQLVQVDNNSQLYLLGLAAALLSDAHIVLVDGVLQVRGEPIEAAMTVFAQKVSVIAKAYQAQFVMPFDVDKKFKAGVFSDGQKQYLFVSGAPEFIVTHAKVADLEQVELGRIIGNKLRVVGLAYVLLEPAEAITKEEQLLPYLSKLQFLGWLGLQDDVRDDVGITINKISAIGIHLVLATGDHLETATHIVNTANLADKQIEIFARVSPQEKLALVQKYRAAGHCVAMIGDGVNDAPSLAAADVGIVMGQSGTEAAKNAADIILLSDTFSSILHAIEQGRHILYTLRRVILYFFATNLGEVLVVLCALSLSLPMPILAAQFLWLNLVTDGFLDMALAMEPIDYEKIDRVQVKLQLIDRGMVFKMIYIALMMGFGTMAVFIYYYQFDLPRARTVTLLTMTMFQWFNAWNCRSEEKSIFTLGLLANCWLLLAMAMVFILQLLVIYVPFMQAVFKTVPVTFSEWLLALVVGSSVLVIEELRKLIFSKYA